MKKLRPYLPFLALVIGALAVYWYRTPAYGSGQQAPDFVGYLPNGDSVHLSDFKGKMLLLDFWGSWCGPCRRANKDLVYLYDKFAPSGKFEILSVGIDEKKDRWLAAIQKDNLYWKYHVSDLKGFNDHVAKLYGVRSIPTTFLLDANGQILGVKMNKSALETAIQEGIR